jgi:hypothetical protein
VVDRSKFISNKAVNGSAFYARGGYFIVRNSLFKSNVATGDATVYFDNWCCGQGGTVNDSKFFYNTASTNALGNWRNWIDGQPSTVSRNIVAIGNVSSNGSLLNLSGSQGSESILLNWVLAKNRWSNSSQMISYSNQIIQFNHGTITKYFTPCELSCVGE